MIDLTALFNWLFVGFIIVMIICAPFIYISNRRTKSRVKKMKEKGGKEYDDYKEREKILDEYRKSRGFDKMSPLESANKMRRLANEIGKASEYGKKPMSPDELRVFLKEYDKNEAEKTKGDGK